MRRGGAAAERKRGESRKRGVHDRRHSLARLLPIRSVSRHAYAPHAGAYHGAYLRAQEQCGARGARAVRLGAGMWRQAGEVRARRRRARWHELLAHDCADGNKVADGLCRVLDVKAVEVGAGAEARGEQAKARMCSCAHARIARVCARERRRAAHLPSWKV